MPIYFENNYPVINCKD